MAIGTSVLGGMLSGTFLAVLLIPLLYVIVVKLFERKKAVDAAPVLDAPLPADGK